MIRPAPLLTHSPARRATTALLAGAAAGLAIAASAGWAKRAPAPPPTFLLVQAIDGDAGDRRRNAAQVLRRLHADPAVATAGRVPVADVRADLARALGAAPAPDLPLPEMVDARLVPGVDTDAVRARLRDLPGLRLDVSAAAPLPARAPHPVLALAACLVAAGAIAAIAAADTSRHRPGVEALHRLGVTRGRMMGEILLPVIGSAVAGVLAGTMLVAPLHPGITMLAVAAVAAALIATALGAALLTLRRLVGRLP